jgi:paraquat-inducible protein B
LNEAIGDGRKLIRNADGSIDSVKVSTLDMINTATEAIKEAEKVLAELRDQVKTESGFMYRTNEALREVEKSARSVRVLADYFERHPEALLRGKGEPGGN